MRVAIWISRDENGWWGGVDAIDLDDTIHETTWFPSERAAYREAKRWARINNHRIVN